MDESDVSSNLNDLIINKENTNISHKDSITFESKSSID